VFYGLSSMCARKINAGKVGDWGRLNAWKYAGGGGSFFGASLVFWEELGELLELIFLCFSP
jgi:hypothetical protein